MIFFMYYMGFTFTDVTPQPLHRLQPLLLASTEMTSGNPNQTCPAPTARSATPGQGCHRPPRPTFAVTVQEHLNSARDHQKVCTTPPNLSRHFVGSVPSDSHTLLLTRRAFSPQVFRQLPSLPRSLLVERLGQNLPVGELDGKAEQQAFGRGASIACRSARSVTPGAGGTYLSSKVETGENEL